MRNLFFYAGTHYDIILRDSNFVSRHYLLNNIQMDSYTTFNNIYYINGNFIFNQILQNQFQAFKKYLISKIQQINMQHNSVNARPRTMCKNMRFFA